MLQRKLGRYELLRVLGKGAMGVVYEGRDPNLDRRVAIKTIIVDDLGADAAAEYEARFQVEARSAARLQHPNIVTVYDSARDGGTAFLVMEFIEGDDLKQHLDRGQSYDAAQALRLVVDLLAALDFAHRQGVVHRDVKPANLLIERGGRLKLTDFGVARITGEATRTQGSMIGTLKYMAPEQVQGQKSDGRADLFSAAVVAYHLLTGVRPFDGDNDFTIIHQIIGHTPPAPSTVKPGLPAALDAVFERALAKNRDDRFQTGAEFSTALRHSLQDLVPDGPDTPTIPGTNPGLRRGDTLPGTSKDQELELEYWRSVRDSVDAGELQDFLARFPQGLYADLARRRIDRLTGASDPDRTIMHGSTIPSATRPPVEPTATLPMSRESAEGVVQAAAAAAGPTRAPAAARPVPPPKEDTVVRALPGKRQGMPVWLAGAAVAVVAGIAIWWGRAPMRAPAAPTVATAPAAAPAAPGAVTPAAVPAPAAGASNSPTAAREVAPSQAVSAARPASSPGAAKQRSTVAAASRTRPAQTAQQESAPRAGLVPPAVTCRDKVFLAKQFCVYNECQKPGYHDFPACVQLREEAKLREGTGKYGN